MKIIKKRYLRGPNLYHSQPCLLTVINLEELAPASSQTPAGFAGRLLELTLELQGLVGHKVSFGRIHPVNGSPGQYRVVCGYESERVAGEAFALAMQLVEAAAKGGSLDLAGPLEQLRDTASHAAIGTSTAAVLAAAARRGIPSHRITEGANLFQLGWGSRQKRLQATITGATSHVAVGIASDKQLTKALLKQAGLPVPEGDTVTTPEQACRVAARLREPVTVKPLDANQGKGVTTACTTPDEVTAAFEHARRYSRHIIVERFLKGRDYRVLVAGGAIAAASCRRPPYVTGDGKSTIAQLVEAENQDPARGAGHTNILTKIALDELALAMLRKQGYEFDSVPAAGACVELRSNANLSTGGTAEDVTGLLPEETAQTCIRAAKTIGLDIAGIDIVCQDISQPLREQGGGIIEVNAAPGIRMHQYPSRGKPRDAGEAIVEAMFGGGDGRIPVIAITGTNGKTTTTRLVAHAAALTGLSTGMTTTDGVYINKVMTMRGDCTGYLSARAVLSAPDVDIAVLETARGGILKRGLAFDRCDVGVVLNVSADHLGMDGIDTIEDLAQVKAVVAKSASRAVVLNAADSHCVAMAADLNRGVEVLYFAQDADNPVLLRHLESGGRAVYTHDNAMVLANGARHEALLDVRAMPFSLQGLARYNIDNALAAAAALVAAGFSNEQVAAGLESFVSDGRHNPLRSNVFDVEGVTVIVDYAHNCAAYAALAGMARAMTAGRVVGVVSAPGDRRDEDLVHTGKVCAAGFDDLVVYESCNRGRGIGETARLIAQGARADKPGGRLHCKLDVHEAIRCGLSMCKPGDVLVFGCGSCLEELVDALRPGMPQVAERITAEMA